MHETAFECRRHDGASEKSRDIARNDGASRRILLTKIDRAIDRSEVAEFDNPNQEARGYRT